MNYSVSEKAFQLDGIRAQIIGIDKSFRVLDGNILPYVYLDNAASTPSFEFVWEKIGELLQFYSGVHRGTGHKSLISTRVYEEAREIIGDFVGADTERDSVIFTSNTTDSVNKLVYALHLDPDDVVITSLMEHHSNDLPWRYKVQEERIELLPDGSLDIGDLEKKLGTYGDRVKLVAITGASNVTGVMPPIYNIAELVHEHGCKLFVDCAQLVAHRKINMGKVGTPQRLDFIAFSGHKMYAPFGSGVLIGPRDVFEAYEPGVKGGGTIELVTLDEVLWDSSPYRQEAGSPNVMGAVSIAIAASVLTELSLDKIAEHEFELISYTIEKLSSIKGIRFFGPSQSSKINSRLGVLSFELDSTPSGKVAAILGFEGAIGVRHGCFCAHPYVVRLLKIPDSKIDTLKEQVRKGDKSRVPGIIRISLGCYNTKDEIDYLATVLTRIVNKEYSGDYLIEKHTGVYYPRNFDMSDLEDYFRLPQLRPGDDA
jgi:cysteine desulfurase/selenocysteine lyase